MNKEELAKVLENHMHWLNEDCDGWENMKANLRGADLRNADLSYADLGSADLRNADLRYAHLRDANLCNADLRNAKLHYADLRDANLCNADLSGADLGGADLCDANLCNADLSGAKMPFIPYACPDFGSFIGYKKAHGDVIVELEILADAKRCSATSRKCRCDKAKVLSILDMNRQEIDEIYVVSKFDRNFAYWVGEIVSVDDFDENRWNECSTGIHFFVNFQEAVNYN